MLEINLKTRIDESELDFETSRSSGPGGQNVNKVETKVTLLWNVDASTALDDKRRALIRERCAGRINKEGLLRVSSQLHRTQAKNREAVVERFIEILRKALFQDAPRRPMKVPRRFHRRRLDKKRQRSDVKQGRKRGRNWRPDE